MFPPVKYLRIPHPVRPPREGFEAGIVGLAKSQYALGAPFRDVTIRMDDLPTEMAERLKPWVGAADCREEPYRGDYDIPPNTRMQRIISKFSPGQVYMYSCYMIGLTGGLTV